MLSGSLWALAMRWCIRGLGLVSVVILARLLKPEDFGIVAMGALVIGLIDSFAELGTQMLLLRRAEVTRDDCDTAWTLRLIQGAVIAALLVAVAPLAVRYFNEPRLFEVMILLALGSVVSGANNIGMTLVRRELDFATDFRFGLYQKLASFAVTVALAFLLRDYRALAWGMLAGSAAGLVLSYRMHPYRPRPSFAKVRVFLEFSVFAVLSNIAKLLKAKIDVLVVGTGGSSAVMGTYNVASELAAMATQEVVIPVWRGLFPTFSKIKDDHDRFVRAYAHFAAVMASLCLPLGLGLWACADALVPALLGGQWTATIAPLKWLAIGAMLVAMIDVFSGSILFVTGHERASVMLTWLHLALLVPAVAVAAHFGDVEAIAIAAMLAAAVVLPLAMVVLLRSVRMPAVDLWRGLWRPTLAALLMVVAIKSMAIPAQVPPLLVLAAEVAVGGIAYAATLFALWSIAGRPEGAESALWQMLRRWRASRRAA